MILHSRAPVPPLDICIAAFTHFKGLVPGHGFERFLPDGNVEIIIDLAGRPEHIYDPGTLTPIQTCRGMWASGVRTRYLTLSSGHKSELFVIAFRKGRAYPFFPLPMEELSDRVLGAEEVWGRRFDPLREMLLEAPSPEAKFIAAERFLLSLRPRLDLEPCVDHAVRSILADPAGLALGDLYARIGYSPRHFIALFRERLGVAPKTYARLARFQKAVADIERAGKIDWNEVAGDCGFYDQAHFIHEFKRFSGFTPEDYLRRKSAELNYVPVG